MIFVPRLDDKVAIFPPTSQALEEPNGLLATGGDLSIRRLLIAYKQGIFPWYEPPNPILWWTPTPRSVLFLNELHVSRSMRKVLRNKKYTISFNIHFSHVIGQCASVRRKSVGTWIDSDMRNAYMRLHKDGFAHCVSVYDEDGTLQGGVYGVALGRIFFGESMLTLQPNMSKIAFVALVNILNRNKFQLIDCQIETDHLNSFGARCIERTEFEGYLRHYIGDGSYDSVLLKHDVDPSATN